MTEPSDLELMLKTKKGDRSAFDLLIQRYRRPVINFMFRYVSSAADAEDLAHEVFLRVYLSASRYEARAAFSTWLYRIATNLALNHIRDRRPHQIEYLDDKCEDHSDHCEASIWDRSNLTENKMLERERTQQIREALAVLPDNQRLALVLTKYQDLTLKEAAEVMKCSETAIKSLIFRAYTALREQLAGVAVNR